MIVFFFSLHFCREKAIYCFIFAFVLLLVECSYYPKPFFFSLFGINLSLLKKEKEKKKKKSKRHRLVYILFFHSFV